jgi:thioredoxin reductase
LAAGRAEVTRYGVELVRDRVVEIEAGFVARLASGREPTARRILLATGVRDELPDIPGVRERWATDLLHSPYGHGWEVRDQPPNTVPHADGLATGIGCEVDEAGFIIVDATGRTSTAGAWAAGNVVDPRAQVITSAGAGSGAAIAINADLVQEDVEVTLRRRRSKVAGSSGG